MKNTIVMIPVLFCLFFATSSFAQKRWRTASQSTIYGKHYRTTLDSKDIDCTPDFDPEVAEWPLSPQQAIKQARQWIEQAFPEEPAWFLDSLTLSRVMKTKKWKYEIKFRNGDRSGDFLGDTVFTVHVLMDKRILEPKSDERTQALDVPQAPAPLKHVDDQAVYSLQFRAAPIGFLTKQYEELTGWKVNVDTVTGLFTLGSDQLTASQVKSRKWCKIEKSPLTG